MVNTRLILGYNSLDKIAGVIFIARQEIPRNIELSPFLIVNISGTHLAETFDIPKMSVWIDCTAPKLTPTSLPMLYRSRLLSNITRECTTLTFPSAVASLGRPDRPSSSTFSPPLKLCCPFFHCAIRRLLPRSFHKVFMNFLGRHSFLTEVLDNHSDFKFLHFAIVPHLPLLKVLYIINQA